MTPQEQEPSPGDMRKLLDELTDLVGELGLADPSATSQPPVSRTAYAGDDDDTYGDEEYEDDAYAEEPAEEAAPVAVATVETAGLWEAFAPELEANPPRAWSPAAAMAVIEPGSPPRPPRRLRPPPPLHSRLFTAAVAAAALLAIAALVITRLDLGHTSGPPQSLSAAPFEVTSMRTVQATSAPAVAHAPTLDRFARNVPAIYIDIVYRNVTAQDSLRLIISLVPLTGTNQLLTPVSDVVHSNLDPGGEIAVTVEAPPAGFVPGSYTVIALHGDHEQRITFTVDAGPATPSALPSPSGSVSSPSPTALATF